MPREIVTRRNASPPSRQPVKLRLSERWAYEGADLEATSLLLDAVDVEALVPYDIERAFGVPMHGIRALALHGGRTGVLQCDRRGVASTGDLLALSLRHLLTSPRSSPEQYVFALVSARCLPFYFATKMVAELDTDRVLGLRSFKELTRFYTRSSKAYAIPFANELNRAVKAPYESYRRLVGSTCAAYAALYDVLSTHRPTRFRRFVRTHPEVVFMMHFPIPIDLHHTFTDVFHRRPRALRFDRALQSFDGTSSLVEFLRVGASR